MPWECKTMQEIRTEFVSRAIMGDTSISSLCREYGISRTTAYKWMARCKNGESMSDKSHEPFSKPFKTPLAMEEIILNARGEHPTWGARKLKRFLQDKGYDKLPAVSTISDILSRNGCIAPEESQIHTPYKRFEKEAPNRMWQMDFKGHFSMLDNQRCHPLTILDDHSRFSICVDAKSDEKWHTTKPSIEKAFQEYGLPDSILCDNGNPWGDNRGGYTAFDLWMMQLNILPIHGRPLHPQTQGKEERFHRTLKADLLVRVPMRNLAHAQKEFDAYRNCYNNERPHEALNLDVPARHYRASKRKYISETHEPEYDGGRQLRKVNYKGYLSIHQHRYYLSEVFIDKYLEIKPISDHILVLYYGNFQIAEIDTMEQLVVSRKIYRKKEKL